MFWDHVAGVYDLFSAVINRKACTGLQKKIEALVGTKDEVLECACGTGLLTGVMARRCKHLTATDFSARMLLQAEKKFGSCGNVTFRQANILALDFPDESFDVVVAANVIHLLDDPGAALKEMYRVCRPGGRLVIPTYLNQLAGGKPNAFTKLIDRIGSSSSIFKHHFTAGSYRQFLMDAGYPQTTCSVAEGMIPCAVAVVRKDVGTQVD